MAVFQLRKPSNGGRMQKMARDTGKKIGARSRYLGHLAAAQRYRASAGVRSAAERSGRYFRRNPRKSIGAVAALMGLLGYMLMRRRRR